MSGPSNTDVLTPWAPAQPYITDVLGQAKSLYGSQAPLYQDPSANFGFGQATGAVGNALGGTTGLGALSGQISPWATGAVGSAFSSPFGTAGGLDARSAIMQQLSGQPNYSAVNGALNAANQQQWNQFYNNVIPQLNQRASFLGNPSGAIKDLNSAITQMGQNQNLNAQQAYLGQYNLAQQQQANAAQLISQGGLSSQSNALGLGGLAGNLAQGTGAQSLQGASLYPSIAQMPQQNLSDYANILSTAAGKYGTQTQQTQPGSGQTFANVVGGLTAGAGLYNNLFNPGAAQQAGTQAAGTQQGGGLGNAVVGGVRNLFGGGGVTAASADAAGAPALADLGATSAATVGSDGAAITAANDAWLGSQGLGAAGGLGAGSAAAAGAGDAGLAAIGTGAIDEAGAASAASASGALGGTAGASGAGSAAAAVGVPAAAAFGLYAALDSYGAFGDHPDAQTVAFNNWLKGTGTKSVYGNPNGTLSAAGSNIGSHIPTRAYGTAPGQTPAFQLADGTVLNSRASNGTPFDPKQAAQLYAAAKAGTGSMAAYQNYLQQFQGTPGGMMPVGGGMRIPQSPSLGARTL